MVQTEIAAGMYRFAVKDSMGNYIATTEYIPYNILDATTSPRAVLQDAVEGNPEGTLNDRIVRTPSNLVAHGNALEWLDLEYLDSAAHATWVTANFTVQLNVADCFRDYTGRVRVLDKLISLADRVTKTVNGTQTNPLGLDDNPATVANVPAPVLRVIPPVGHNYSPRGYQRFVSSST
ncbi:MAG: hypothetical protein QOE90_927 [Thermoplasmata archaeon]|jgi:hypothetical protein|nr:hypothetical protein [Thermoplasmata archaeon]